MQQMAACSGCRVGMKVGVLGGEVAWGQKQSRKKVKEGRGLIYAAEAETPERTRDVPVVAARVLGLRARSQRQRQRQQMSQGV